MVLCYIDSDRKNTARRKVDAMSKLLCVFFVLSLLFSANCVQNNFDEDELCSNLSTADKDELNEKIEANEKLISALELKLQNVETEETYPNLETAEEAHFGNADLDGDNELQTTQELQRKVLYLQKELEEKEKNMAEKLINVIGLQEALKEKQIKVDDLQKKLEEKEIQVEDLQTKLDEKQFNVMDLQEGLEEKQIKVDDLQKEFEQKQVLLDQCQMARDCLATYVTNLYPNGKQLLVNQMINVANVQLPVQLMNEYPYTSPWIMVVKRFDNSIDFNRGWEELKNGIGSLAGEFFIGLQRLHLLTKSYRCELRVYIETSAYYYNAFYDNFVIGSEDEGYMLRELGNYSGNAGDCLRSNQNSMFITSDRNDNFSCASRKGPWWHWRCTNCNLFSNDPMWNSIKPTKRIYMMIRPTSANL